MVLKSVKTPKEMEPLFEKAEEYVKEYFKDEKRIPSKGMINIGGQRYILIRAISMSVEFLEFIKNKYPGLNEDDAYDAAAKFLFDMAHSIGKSDAGNFHKAMNVTDPIAKLSSGPIHFAYTGWAFVDIFSESKPSPDENYYLIYDHPQSFEADSWIESKKKSKRPVCHMNAGYSSGWCEESFGVTLISKEILCRARGDKYCRFIMAHPERVDKFVAEYKKSNPKLFRSI
ncbi:MAG: 4-vinyl reductase [Candidatus Aenigmatarchaeota archaeon]|nr:4-vinyl reductase [Nanoarchaeota archaeon]